MKISRTTEYTLRALAYLAVHSENRNVLVKELADNENLPFHYISKILQVMTKFDLVIAQKGRGGGYRIADQTRELSIYEIINIVQGPIELDSTLFEDCSKRIDGPYREKWQSINREVNALLKTQKIKDLVN